MAINEAGLVSDLHQDEGSKLRDSKLWNHVAAQNCERSPCLPTQLPSQNRYVALGMVDEGCGKMVE